MTGFTREDMRERIARVVCRGDVRRHYDPAPDVGDLWADATDHGRSEWLNDADAIMDELGLWEAYEALDAIWTLASRPDLPPDADWNSVIDGGFEALARLRGEPK